jgi:hypothetical protein
MSDSVARGIASAQLAAYRTKSFQELAALVGDDDHPAGEFQGGDGLTYWLEIEVFCDNADSSDQVLRVRASICGGGVGYQAPLCDDFLIAADGTFADE